MQQAKKVLMLALVAAGLSLLQTGCRADNRTVASERSSSDHPKSDHPKSDHPKSDHPKSEEPQ